MTAVQTVMTQLWSVAGTDSSGGAGLGADQRAAAALGMHLCPVVAAVTAQNSQAVTHIHAIPASVLQAQLQALADDVPDGTQGIVIKTGLLGSADNVGVVAQQVQLLRQRYHVHLVIDPVLRASTGAAFADAAVVQAYQRHLLPLADLVTPNMVEAARLCGLEQNEGGATDAPALATKLLNMGAQAVCITGGDIESHIDSVRSLHVSMPTSQHSAQHSLNHAPFSVLSDGYAHDWMQTPHAQGWLGLPRINTPHTHGTGCTFASSAAAAVAQGFVVADALVLAKMASAHAIENHRVLGQGNGSVYANAGFHRARFFPTLGWDTDAPNALPLCHAPHADAGRAAARRLSHALPKGLYTLASSAEQLLAQLQAGARVVQLRMKTPEHTGKHTARAWQQTIETAIAQAVRYAQQYGATLFVNDHWQQAIACQAAGIHLGQEDVLAMTAKQRVQLNAYQQRGGLLGISSHSLWELARAQSLNPAYIACGPVWATTTKDMPWQPQGIHNLRYWVQVAGKPVVAIGGVLNAGHVQQCAEAGAHNVCAVRAVAHNPADSIAAFQQAYQQGQALQQEAWHNHPPKPSLLAHLTI